MPIYRCDAAPGVLTGEIKSAIAQEITRIHVEATRAPRSFVHVIFRELPPGTHYKGGEEDASYSIIRCGVRAGRTLEVRQRILQEISDSWSRLTGQPATQLMLSLSQTDASDVMEAGLILPEPGQETAWFDHHRDQLSGLAPDGVHGL
jgi:phenylpyruvate tautomerase PptA (4-oxalocrotonate tautomerase family)